MNDCPTTPAAPEILGKGAKQLAARDHAAVESGARQQPANGLGTLADRRSMVAWSRNGEVERILQRRAVEVMIHRHFDGLVSHVADFQKNVREQFPLHRNLPAGGVGIAGIGIVEGDALAEEGGQSEAGTRGPLDAVGKGIGERGGGGEIAVVGGHQRRGLAESRRVVAGDAIGEVVDARAAADARSWR